MTWAGCDGLPQATDHQVETVTGAAVVCVSLCKISSQPAQVGQVDDVTTGSEDLAIHRARGNGSEDRWRRALGFIYYAEGAEVLEDEKRNYEESLKAKWEAEGRL